jgi:hypothetical protein
LLENFACVLQSQAALRRSIIERHDQNMTVLTIEVKAHEQKLRAAGCAVDSDENYK